jgi:hypothetical protein
MDEQKNIDETTFDALLEPIAQEIGLIAMPIAIKQTTPSNVQIIQNR